jgi:hypothetical protein
MFVNTTSAKTLTVITAVAAGLLMFDVTLPALSGATAWAAQVKQQQRPVARPVARPAPRVNIPRSNVVRTNPAVMRTNRVTTTNQVNFRRTNVNVGTRPKLVVNPNFNRNLGRTVGPGVPQALVRPGSLKVGPSGAGSRLTLGPGAGLRAGNFVSLNNRVWPMYRGPHRIWWGGGWRTFVPFTALGAVLVGGAYYYPDAYISIARPYCSGVTPDGCQLNWQMVEFEGGGGEWQCVQYCARPGMPPPAQVVTLAAPPPAPAGRCELTLFAEPGFGGVSAPTGEDQPRLAEVGWKNQIGSVQVQAGTWDFFADDEFAGESMRLAPGPYPQLGPDWTRRIGSFMCVQGG